MFCHPVKGGLKYVINIPCSGVRPLHAQKKTWGVLTITQNYI